VAAAVNRYECLGGYDWAKDAHKPALRYVPAGSVYYFESQGTVFLTKQVLETNAIADKGAQIGFGQIFIQEVQDV
ncbi:MAG: type III-B CRISPR module-associated protein Cmr3, partial [Anaerolineales bacterium]|nr:type III-B CRISPR module-associated protein Cmr3 [Anaerolineales bacterium]